jgi:hypothetical protein
MALDMSEFLKGLGEARTQMMDKAVVAVDQFAEHVLGDAQQLTPVATGALQASGTTSPAEVKSESITKQIGFNTDYAAAVHENMDAHHDVGQAQYLTTALRENAPKLGPFLQSKLKEVTG